MKKYIFSSLLLMAGLASCENFFSSTLKVDPPAHTPQLSVHAFFQANDEKIEVSVAQTKALLDNNYELQSVNDARVEVYQAGSLLFTLPLKDFANDPFYNYSFDLEKPLSEYGDNFELRVSHPDYPTVTAIQSFPGEVVPTRLKYVANAGINEFNEPSSGIDIDIPDPSGEENFFEVFVVQVDTIDNQIYPYAFYLTSFDPSVSMGANYESLLVSDKTFNGQQYRLRVLADQTIDPAKVLVYWKNISRAQYLYSASIQAFENSSNNGPFSEPVSVFSNCENGLGVFGLSRENFYAVEE